MTDPLTLDRFQELADAYGGVMARWPIADHAAARRMAATPEGAAILDEALSLDARLDNWTIAVSSNNLADRINGHAGAGVQTGRGRQRWWWSGIGIAATFAGAVAGTAVVTVTTPVDMVTSSTSFGDVAGVDN